MTEWNVDVCGKKMCSMWKKQTSCSLLWKVMLSVIQLFSHVAHCSALKWNAAVLPSPARVAHTFKLGLHVWGQPGLWLFQHSVRPPSSGLVIGHHLPERRVEVEVRPGGGLPPLASALG